MDSPRWQTRIEVDMGDDGEDPRIRLAPDTLMGKLDAMTPFERAEFFWEAESCWCWDCGEELADCTCADEDEGVVP